MLLAHNDIHFHYETRSRVPCTDGVELLDRGWMRHCDQNLRGISCESHAEMLTSPVMQNQLTKEYYKEYLKETEAMFLEPRKAEIWQRLDNRNYVMMKPENMEMPSA